MNVDVELCAIYTSFYWEILGLIVMLIVNISINML